MQPPGPAASFQGHLQPAVGGGGQMMTGSSGGGPAMMVRSFDGMSQQPVPSPQTYTPHRTLYQLPSQHPN